MLRDGVHQRVTRARVHLKQALDADGERAEVAAGRERGDRDARGDGGAGVDVDANSPSLGAARAPGLDQPLAERQHLHAEEDERRAELLERLDGRQSDDGELDRAEGADDPEERVRAVKRREYWPSSTSVAAWSPTMLRTKVYPPHAATMYTYARPARIRSTSCVRCAATGTTRRT